MRPSCLALPYTLLTAAPPVRRCFGRLIRRLSAALIVVVALSGLSALSVLTRRLEVIERALHNTAIIQVPMFPQDRASIQLRSPPERHPSPSLSPGEQYEWYRQRGKLRRA